MTQTTSITLVPGTKVILEDGTELEVVDLKTHEEAAIKHFVHSATEAALAYEQLAIIYYSNLWIMSGASDWSQYIDWFGEKLTAANSPISASMSTVQQRLRDFARYVLFAGVRPDVAFSLSPSVSNRLQRIAKAYSGWVRRKDNEDDQEGSIREWADPQIRKNVAGFLALDEKEPDAVLVRELVKNLAGLPSAADAHEVLDKHIFEQDPKSRDNLHFSKVRVDKSGASVVQVTWSQTRGEEIVGTGNFHIRITPTGTPESVVRRMAERFRLQVEDFES